MVRVGQLVRDWVGRRAAGRWCVNRARLEVEITVRRCESCGRWVSVWPSSVPGSTVTFHGQFELLSLTATILPDGFEGGGGFGVSVAGPQGQVVGGLVVGPLVAAGTVYLVGATFNNPMFCRLGGGGGDVAGDGNGEFCGVVWEQNGGREVQQPQQQQHY